MTETAVDREPWAIAADLGLLALALGTTAGLNRLFIGWGFLATLAPLVALAWFIPVLLRRVARWSVRSSLGVHLAVGIVVLTVRFAPGTHFAGVPTGRTVSALRDAVDTSFGDFSQLVAPVPVSDGFLVVLAGALWVFAYFADTAAMRYRGVVQAAVPHTAVFLALGILARGSGRAAATLWFGVGTATYAVTQVGLAATERRWLEGSPRRGTAAAVRAAAVLALVGVVGSLAITPLLPGGTDPVVDLRAIGRGQGPRTVVSPFVGLRSLLGHRSSEVLFTVEAAEPAYWRLTALERFDPDRQLWMSSAPYSPTDGVLPESGSSRVPGRHLTQEIEVTGLGGLWLPGAYVPDRIDIDAAVSFDRRSASIILDDDDVDEVSYRLESVIPSFGSDLRTAPSVDSDEPIDQVHFETTPLSATARRELGQAITPRDDDHLQMKTLQNWFRTEFAYDESVDFSRSEDPLGAFLTDRRGFCQQFSSAFAQIARSLGMASRVAIGFTPGDGQPAAAAGSSGQGSTLYTVRGRHAHAWPEVYFEGLGWVPFEPTPQRGDPQSVLHTGVAPQQVAPPDVESTTTTLPSNESPDVPGEQPDNSVAPTTAPDSRVEAGARSATTGGSVAWWIAAALLIVAAVTLLSRRRGMRRAAARRARPEDPDRAAVVDAWSDAVAALAPLHVVPGPTETPLEVVRRVRPEVAGLGELAEAVTRARYRATPPTREEIHRAKELAAELPRAIEALSRPGRGDGSDREPVSPRR